MSDYETVRDGFYLFWKGKLSQWHPSVFKHEFEYRTAEHWMMAQKAVLFGDTDAFEKILVVSSPKEAKDLGRLVKGFDKDIWDSRCFDIVFRGNMLKFGQNPELKKHLLDTGDQILVEASPYDKVWGIGLGQDDSRAVNPAQWEGKNLLGQVLMVVRHELRNQ